VLGGKYKMQKSLNAVESQQIMIHILTNASSKENLWIKRELVEKMANNGDPDADEIDKIKMYMDLCIRTAHELRKDPEKYNTFDTVFRTIIARQKTKSTENVKKKEYREALGIKYNSILERVLSGKVMLNMGQIDDICSGFKDESNRRFWKNQILCINPDISYPEKDICIEYKCLLFLCSVLTEEKFNCYIHSLNQTEQRQILIIREAAVTKKETVKETVNSVNRLYEYINSKARRMKLAIKEVAEQELGISENTWYARKKVWENAEEMDFKQGVPHARLARVQLMVLSVIFELDYPETIMLLALAGYRMKNGEPDCTLIEYLGKEVKNKEEMEQFLLDGWYHGEW